MGIYARYSIRKCHGGDPSKWRLFLKVKTQNKTKTKILPPFAAPPTQFHKRTVNRPPCWPFAVHAPMSAGALRQPCARRCLPPAERGEAKHRKTGRTAGGGGVEGWGDLFFFVCVFFLLVGIWFLGVWFDRACVFCWRCMWFLFFWFDFSFGGWSLLGGARLRVSVGWGQRGGFSWDFFGCWMVAVCGWICCLVVIVIVVVDSFWLLDGGGNRKVV